MSSHGSGPKIQKIEVKIEVKIEIDFLHVGVDMLKVEANIKIIPMCSHGSGPKI